MIVFLFITLLMLFVIHLIMYKADWMSPTILSLISYILSVGVLMISSNRWGLSITTLTFLIIVVGLIFLGLGELTSRSLFTSDFKKKTVNKISTNIIIPSKKFTNVLILFLFITAILYFNHIRNAVGTSYEQGEMLIGLYRSAEHIDMNIFLKLSLIVSTPIAYFFMLTFIEHLIYLDCLNYRLLIPIIMYIIIQAMSSGRINILYLFFTAVAFSFITYQNKLQWNLKINFKSILKILLLIMLVLVFFYLLGFLTGKSNEYDFFYTITVYVGTPVAALDTFLESFRYKVENFGSETLIGIHNLFNTIGIELSIGSASRNLEFVKLGSMPTRTNIYTAFRSILNDYNIIGMLLYHFSFGFIISFFYEKVKRNYDNKLLILMSVYILRLLFFQFINERLLINFFTSTTMIFLITFKILLKYSDYKSVNLDEKL